jgi:hypothetical protein
MTGLNYPSSLVTLYLYGLLHNVFAQRFVTRFHYLVFNVHLRWQQGVKPNCHLSRSRTLQLKTMQLKGQISGNKKPRHRRDGPSLATSPTRLPYSAEVFRSINLPFGVTDKGYYIIRFRVCQSLSETFFVPFILPSYRKRRRHPQGNTLKLSSKEG